MYIKAEIDVVPGQLDALAALLNTFYVPVLSEVGWVLHVSIQDQSDPRKITNIWDVGDKLDAGLAPMKKHTEYPAVKTALSKCVVKEDITIMQTWLSP